MKKQWLTMTVCGFTTTAALAADTATMRYDKNPDRPIVERHTSADWRDYSGNELNFSFFGLGRDRKLEHDGLGGGVSYFFNRYVGIEAFAYSESLSDHLVDNVDGNLVMRFPIGHGLAPYGFGGGGRQFDPDAEWNLDAGAGLEWRFLHHVGLFADGRYVWALKTHDNYVMARLGIKVGF